MFSLNKIYERVLPRSKIQKSLLCFIALNLVFICAVSLIDVDIAYAADGASNESYIGSFNFGSSMGQFENTVKAIALGLAKTGKIISVILTAIAGCMYIFNLQEGNKLLWGVILGLGLAMNVGSLFTAIFPNTTAVVVNPSTGRQEFKVEFVDDKAEGGSNTLNIAGNFMDYYTKNIIVPGAKNVVPIAVQLTLLLAFIDTAMKLAFDVVSGDKAKFLVTVALKVGFYIFLITNWLGTGPQRLNLMDALSTGFESIGYTMAGAGTKVASGAAVEGSSTFALGVNSIFNNAKDVLLAYFTACTKSIFTFNPIVIVVNLIVGLVVFILLILTGFEMFMCRLEFYTMALLTIMLIPFGVIDQLKFLFEKAIGAMFNLALKTCVVAFLLAMSCTMITNFVNAWNEKTGLMDAVKKISESNGWVDTIENVAGVAYDQTIGSSESILTQSFGNIVYALQLILLLL